MGFTINFSSENSRVYGEKTSPARFLYICISVLLFTMKREEMRKDKRRFDKLI